MIFAMTQSQRSLVPMIILKPGFKYFSLYFSWYSQFATKCDLQFALTSSIYRTTSGGLTVVFSFISRWSTFSVRSSSSSLLFSLLSVLLFHKPNEDQEKGARLELSDMSLKQSIQTKGAFLTTCLIRMRKPSRTKTSVCGGAKSGAVNDAKVLTTKSVWTDV